MGKCDPKYSLSSEMEVDEDFFSTECPEDEKTSLSKQVSAARRKARFS